MTNRRRPVRHPLLPVWMLVFTLTPMVTLGAPVDGQFIDGSGTISQAGTTTTITQTSQHASLNWQGFNIAPTETVHFIQPSASAIAVNRIFDTNGSQLLGQLQANGQVWLINPNGVLFGAGSQVNVGALLASTLDVNDSSLNAGTRNFSGNSQASVISLGSINTSTGGYVVLLANQVSNQGQIFAQSGTVALGAGSAATLSFAGNSLLRMQVDQSVLNSLATNGGLIRADGGLVLMSAGARDSLLASVVNNSGIIEARTVTEQAGGIILLGGMQAGSVQLSGTLDASAPFGSNGGFIETSAAHVTIADTARVTTTAIDGRFGTWLIDPKDFNVGASGSDFNAGALSTALDSSSIELQSSQGAGTGSGNININAAVSWNANSTLTLTASNNVNVNANITATGITAGLVINPNTSNGSDSASGSGVFKLQNGASITLSGANPSLAIGGVIYTVINTLDALQSMNTATNAHYALGSNIDAADTLSWNGGRGFMPIGSSGTLFTGTLDGLGHNVHDLSIDQRTVGAVTANVGLIGSAGTGSVIQNIGVVNGNIKGGAGTGGLVGSNLTGSISNSYFTGNVTGNAGTGGLVGSTDSGSISNSYSVGDVVGEAGTGGLVGSSTSGNISYSYHTGNVTGAAGTGGLIGSITSGSISNSYSIGNVEGQAGSGGLAGSVTSGSVSTSYAVGSVIGAAGTGGLLGETSGPVVFSYWDITVGPATSIGGGTGLTSAQLQDQNNLVGFDFNTIWYSFAGYSPVLASLMAEVTVTANSVTKFYDGLAFSGGNGVSYSNLPGGSLPTGLSFSGSSQGALNASGSPYAITPGGLVSSQAVRYRFVDGNLTILPVAVNLTGSRAYDGTVNMLASAMTIGTLVGTDVLNLSGIGTLANKNAGSGKSMSVGTLALENSGSGLATNYTLTGSTFSANIAQAAISLASSAVSKTYDGGLSATGSAVVTSGSLMTGDSLSGGSFAFTDKNVGSANKTVITSSVTVGDGTNNNNYLVSYTNNNASTINAANLIIGGISVNDKVADGTSSATLTGTPSVAALGTDVLAIGGAGVGNFADALVGNLKPVTILGFSLLGTDAGNYNLLQPAGLTANITPADTSNPTMPSLAGMIPLLPQSAQTACNVRFFKPNKNGDIIAMGPSAPLTNCGIKLSVNSVSMR